MCDRQYHNNTKNNDHEIKKQRSSLISVHVKILSPVFISIALLLHANAASAWFVNSFLLYQTGLPDAYSAAQLGCQHGSATTRIASVSFTSVEPATATVKCERYDETTATWWYWKAPFIAKEPGDPGYFMGAKDFENEDQSKSEACSKKPINRINGNKYKIYTFRA